MNPVQLSLINHLILHPFDIFCLMSGEPAFKLDFSLYAVADVVAAVVVVVVVVVAAVVVVHAPMIPSEKHIS